MGWWNRLLGRTPSARQPQPCYVEFEVANLDALERLTAMVTALKADKVAEKGRSDDEWATSFSSEELSTFWSPGEEERQAWDKYWFSTPLPKRHSPEMPSPPWHFGSMLEAILENGDYDLVGVRPSGDYKARLEYDPHAYPYGGTGALRALVRAFGHRVIGVDDGTGYELGDPQSPRWTPEMQVES